MCESALAGRLLPEQGDHSLRSRGARGELVWFVHVRCIYKYYAYFSNIICSQRDSRKACRSYLFFDNVLMYREDFAKIYSLYLYFILSIEMLHVFLLLILPSFLVLLTSILPSSSSSLLCSLQVKTSARFGVLLPAGEVRVDFPAVMARMRQLRSAIAPHDGVDR